MCWSDRKRSQELITTPITPGRFPLGSMSPFLDAGHISQKMGDVYRAGMERRQETEHHSPLVESESHGYHCCLPPSYIQLCQH